MFTAIADEDLVTTAALSRFLKRLKQHWFLLCVSFILGRFLIRKYISPLRAFPGPLLASGSRSWKGGFEHHQVLLAKNLDTRQYGVHGEAAPNTTTFFSIKDMVYFVSPTSLEDALLSPSPGSIVRIAPNEISLSSPKAAMEVFKVGKGFSKTDFYSVFPPPENPDIFTETREHVHAAKKRVAATPYSMASMMSMNEFIERVEAKLTKQLDLFAAREAACNLGDWLHFFAFDVCYRLLPFLETMTSDLCLGFG